MAKCKHCISKVDGEATVVVKVGLFRKLHFCSEDCQKAYALGLLHIDPKLEERERLREQRQLERNKLREAGKL